MKKIFLLCSLSFLICCKKKEEPVPEPEPVKYGALTVSLEPYDSLGDALTDASNIRVRLNAAVTGSTDVSGKIVFSNLEYGNYFPEPFREGWEGGPTAANLNVPALSISIPFVKRSGFKLQNLASQTFNKDSLMISFTLDKAIPSGKACKVAIIASTSNALSGNNFDSFDQLSVTTTSTIVNVSKLKNMNTFISALDSSTVFYLNAIPVSFGSWSSNVLPKPLLLGDNLFTPNYLVLKKNWK